MYVSMYISMYNVVAWPFREVLVRYSPEGRVSPHRGIDAKDARTRPRLSERKRNLRMFGHSFERQKQSQRQATCNNVQLFLFVWMYVSPYLILTVLKAEILEATKTLRINQEKWHTQWKSYQRIPIWTYDRWHHVQDGSSWCFTCLVCQLSNTGLRGI